MKVISRSEWTSSVPKINIGTEDLDGLPNFRAKDLKGISIFQPGNSALFVERDPYQIFTTILKEDFSIHGYGDIQYNLGVAANVNGVFCLRGLCNKSAAHKDKVVNSQYVSILALLGNDERPTDLLLQNLVDALVLVLGRNSSASNLLFHRTTDRLKEIIQQYVTTPVGIPTPVGYDLTKTFSRESTVHTFDLIETLSYWGYYRGRNDATYGPICQQAVRELQADLRDSKLYLKRIDGVFGRYTREAFLLFLKQLNTTSSKELQLVNL